MNAVATIATRDMDLGQWAAHLVNKGRRRAYEREPGTWDEATLDAWYSRQYGLPPHQRDPRFAAYDCTLEFANDDGDPEALERIARWPDYYRGLAKQQGVPFPATLAAPATIAGGQGSPSVIDPTTLDGVAVPARQWIVRDWLPCGYATLNYGEGGTGKTLLAQQLLTSCATGRPWLGLPVEQCRSFGLFTEDDEAEIHERQAAINAAMGLSFTDLGAMRWACPVGQDNALIRFPRSGKPELTDRFRWLRETVLDFGARLVALDTAATLFGGNEIDRAQVSAFVGQALTSLAQEIGGAVVLNAHPSRAGKATGSGDSGSTAWSASARSRWSLTVPQVEGEADPDRRLLTRMKSNGASLGATIDLRWRDWCFEAPDRAGDGAVAAAFQEASRKAEAQRQFLTMLARCDASNVPVSMAKSAGNYAPRVFFRRTDAGGFTLREFDAAMHALLSAGRIVLECYGRTGDQRRRIALAPEADPPEPCGTDAGACGGSAAACGGIS